MLWCQHKLVCLLWNNFLVNLFVDIVILYVVNVILFVGIAIFDTDIVMED